MEMSRRFNEEAVHRGEERHVYDDVSRVKKEKKEIGSGCFIIQCIYGCLGEAILPFIYKAAVVKVLVVVMLVTAVVWWRCRWLRWQWRWSVVAAAAAAVGGGAEVRDEGGSGAMPRWL
ncbi:hypothetical protein Tco_1493121 [Tanacetum coccineum]